MWLQAFGNFVDIEFNRLYGIFGLLLLYTIQFCFEQNSIFVDLFLGLRKKLFVDFVPALGVPWCVWFGGPIRNVTLYELQP